MEQQGGVLNIAKGERVGGWGSCVGGCFLGLRTWKNLGPGCGGQCYHEGREAECRCILIKKYRINI